MLLRSVNIAVPSVGTLPITVKADVKCCNKELVETREVEDSVGSE